MDPEQKLSRRERQIMQTVFSMGGATAKEIAAAIPDPPSRTAVRTMLGILVKKKLLKHRCVGREFVYSPTRSRKKAGQGALKSVLKTFFGGSFESLVASHFADPDLDLTDEQLKNIEKIIKQARKRASGN